RALGADVGSGGDRASRGVRGAGVIFRKGRFADVIRRQLDLFERETPDVIEEARERLAAYNRADRDEAEELYGDYVDAVETGTEILAGVRDYYARNLDDPDRYCLQV